MGCQPMPLGDLAKAGLPGALSGSLLRIRRVLRTFRRSTGGLSRSRGAVLQQIESVRNALRTLKSTCGNFSLRFTPLSALVSKVNRVRSDSAAAFTSITGCRRLIYRLIRRVPRFATSVHQTVHGCTTGLMRSRDGARGVGGLHDNVLRSSSQIPSVSLTTLRSTRDRLRTALGRGQLSLLTRVDA